MNKQLIDALISNLTTTTFLLSNFLKELDAEIEDPIETVTHSFKKHYIERKSFDIISEDYVMSFINNKFNMDVTAQGRKADVVNIRIIACYLLEKYSRLSLKSIGRIMGGRDHSTVIHSLSKLNTKMADDKKYSEYVVSLENELIEYFNKNAA